MKNLHFHVLFTDGVFLPKSNGDLRFYRVNAPTSKELNALVATISERVARYISRPALSEARLELTDQGMVRYALKTAYRNGTTHVVCEPLDFMAKLAAMVPRPRTNLTRFHGALGPNSRYRERVTPASVRKFKNPAADVEADGLEEPDLTVGKRKGLCWAKRLKRVFNIEVSIPRRAPSPQRLWRSDEDRRQH